MQPRERAKGNNHHLLQIVRLWEVYLEYFEIKRLNICRNGNSFKNINERNYHEGYIRRSFSRLDFIMIWLSFLIVSLKLLILVLMKPVIFFHFQVIFDYLWVTQLQNCIFVHQVKSSKQTFFSFPYKIY